jgi:hypothetical protein
VKKKKKKIGRLLNKTKKTHFKERSCQRKIILFEKEQEERRDDRKNIKKRKRKNFKKTSRKTKMKVISRI